MLQYRKSLRHQSTAANITGLPYRHPRKQISFLYCFLERLKLTPTRILSVQANIFILGRNFHAYSSPTVGNLSASFLARCWWTALITRCSQPSSFEVSSSPFTVLYCRDRSFAPYFHGRTLGPCFQILEWWQFIFINSPRAMIF